MQPEDTTSTATSTPMPATGTLAANGVNRCLKCGASDVHFDGKWLVCAYCQYRWNTAVLAQELHLSDGIENLAGTSVLKGASDIDTSSLVTVECAGCGASVAVNSETSPRATCHWCRPVLSLNNSIDNHSHAAREGGSVPEQIRPPRWSRDLGQERPPSTRARRALAESLGRYSCAYP